MSIDTFRKEIESYLPIDYNDQDNNTYRSYLLEALSVNWENEKYQFSILSANMLFMSYLYKGFCFLVDKNIDKVNRMLSCNNKLRVFKPYDLSIISEKELIENYMSVFDFHINKKNEVKRLIDVRDECAHASGFVQYDKDNAETVLKQYELALNKVYLKHEIELIKIFCERLKNYWENDQEFLKTTASFFTNFISKERISLKEIQSIYNNKNKIKLLLSELVFSDEEKAYRNLSYFLIEYYLGKSIEMIQDNDSFLTLKSNCKDLIENNLCYYDNIQMQLENDFADVSQFWFNDNIEELTSYIGEGIVQESELDCVGLDLSVIPEISMEEK